jgi:hypothetical protein
MRKDVRTAVKIAYHPPNSFSTKSLRSVSRLLLRACRNQLSLLIAVRTSFLISTLLDKQFLSVYFCANFEVEFVIRLSHTSVLSTLTSLISLLPSPYRGAHLGGAIMGAIIGCALLSNELDNKRTAVSTHTVAHLHSFTHKLPQLHTH